MSTSELIRVALFNLLLAGSCAYAFWRGAAPERIVALAFAGAALATFLVLQLTHRPFVEQRVVLFLINAALFVCLLWLALHADRYWTLWAAAFQLAQLGVDIAVQFDTTIIGWTYAIMHALWGYIAVIILAVGTFRHRRRVLSGQSEPSWSLAGGPWS